MCWRESLAFWFGFFLKLIFIPLKFIILGPALVIPTARVDFARCYPVYCNFSAEALFKLIWLLFSIILFPIPLIFYASNFLLNIDETAEFCPCIFGFIMPISPAPVEEFLLKIFDSRGFCMKLWIYGFDAREESLETFEATETWERDTCDCN